MPTEPAQSSSSPRAQLRFESEAAYIQLESARLLRGTTGEFAQFYRTSRWLDQEGLTALAGISQCGLLSRRWDDLAPPAELRLVWQEVAQHLRALGQLYEELYDLQRRPDGQQAGAVLKLQAAFITRLRWMNQSEYRLREGEEFMRG